MNYEEMINEIVNVAKNININNKNNGDGRIDSAIKEQPFLEELKKKLIELYPHWEIIISQPRAACDVIINNLRINLKLTNCKTSDNSINKQLIYYSITGLLDYPYSSNWNTFIEYLKNAKQNKNIKLKRDYFTEYHYLVKNKINGNVLLKSIFDIHTYNSNPNNILQINWKKEFMYINEKTKDEDYLDKVKYLISTIQKSIKEMINKTQKFANENIDLLIIKDNI